jgi:hypothetical protein
MFGQKSLKFEKIKLHYNRKVYGFSIICKE